MRFTLAGVYSMEGVDPIAAVEKEARMVDVPGINPGPLNYNVVSFVWGKEE